MSDIREKPISEIPAADTQLKPSWTPLLWLAISMIVLIALAELLFEFALEALHLIGEGIFYLVEGSEEVLIEDTIESLFHLSAREAELITAWTINPLKLLLAFFLIRWLWRVSRTKLIPALLDWAKKQWRVQRLAWSVLSWPWKTLVIALLVGGLFVLI